MFSTVDVDASLTILNQLQSLNLNRFLPMEKMSLKLFRLLHFCGTQLAVGNFTTSVSAFFSKQTNATGGYSSRNTAQVEEATVIDIGDQTYQNSLSTLIPAKVSLILAFGDGCRIESDANAVSSRNADEESNVNVAVRV